MKKTIIFILAFVLSFTLVACTNGADEFIAETTLEHTTTIHETTTEAITFTWPIPDVWPERDSHRDTGEYHDSGDWIVGRYRTIFYALPYHFVRIIGIETYDRWQLSRSNEQFHNEIIAVTFVRDFNISREDFQRANDAQRQWWESFNLSPNGGVLYELYPVELIFSFDNERINEFFRWENSIFAHEIGLPNPLRGDWVDGSWQSHPNWMENPAWRDHPFWPYLPFGDINDSTSVVWDSYAAFRAANPQ